ncbi:uncharacterized protein LOC117111335 [Anneissia japonica]|uniref:uncharacterized protein LOC117111335 n=1 Tax=Anneissia japonica TaxID=1529436 RepID=UPI0014258EAB|nr:uncharacterized protein LOC117111335 [Anneissia japonica]
MPSYSKDEYLVGSDLSDLSDFENLSDLEKEINLNDENDADDENLCVCGEIGTTNMISCAGKSCSVQLFHFECVGLSTADSDVVTEDWICNECRGNPSTSRNYSKKKNAKKGSSKKKMGNSKLVSSAADESDKTKKQKKRQKEKGSRKSKAKVLRPPSHFTKEMAEGNAVQYVKAALQAIPEKSVFKKNYPNAVAAREIVRQILCINDQSEFEQFSKCTVNELFHCLQSGATKYLSVEADNEVWRSFHLYKIKSIGSWQRFLTGSNIEFDVIPANLVLQEVLLDVMVVLMRENHLVNATDDSAEPSSLTLTKDEEQVLRYAAGYIPHALLKHYSKLKGNAVAEKLSELLKKWRGEGDISASSFLLYTKEWTDRQNRGGLFPVSDKLFLFFRELEVEYQTHVSSKTLAELRGVNLNNLLLGKFHQNQKINRCWCAVVNGELSDNLSTQLQRRIFLYWIKIRSKAFLKVYLDIQKKNNAASQRGEKALRKGLR